MCWISLTYFTFCQIMCFNKILMVFVRFFYAHTKTPWFEVDSFVWWRWHSLSSSSLLVLLSGVVAVRWYPSNIARSTILVFFFPFLAILGYLACVSQKPKLKIFVQITTNFRRKLWLKKQKIVWKDKKWLLTVERANFKNWEEDAEQDDTNKW